MTTRNRNRTRNLRPARDADTVGETLEWLASVRTEEHDGLTFHTFQGRSDIGVMGEDTAPFPAPDALSDTAPPPLPSHWDPEPAFSSLGSWRDHTAAVRCDYPAAPGDRTIPCGAQHSDPAEATFRGLWRSAQAAGWHLDTYGRRVCPGCQMGPEYRTLYPLTIYADGGAHPATVGIAEHDLFRDVLDTARRGRHRRAGAA